MHMMKMLAINVMKTRNLSETVIHEKIRHKKCELILIHHETVQKYILTVHYFCIFNIFITIGIVEK
jgi:hypothetical protein